MVFENLISQLPQPYMVLGDFNAHNTLWGDSQCDARGRLIENFLLSTGTCLFNKKEPTFYSTRHNKCSAIDLTIGSPSLLPHFEWSVIKNPYGSDHYPIILHTAEQLGHNTYPPRWKLESADWQRYRELSYVSRNSINSLSIDGAVSYITAVIIGTATNCIQQTHGSATKKRIPWWNDACRKARKDQNKAWGLFVVHQRQKTL